MIPRRLTLKGLYSYRSEQTIDFEQLVEARLFGIFGAVGSGKSSILEAISFALYGVTERLQAEKGRNYNMMNLKSDKLLIRFEFEAYGSHAGIYQFEVTGRRNSKQFDKVPAFQHRHLKWQDDDWLPIDESAEDIIGLSYDNFRRAIIIPQGKFQEFLQLKDKARTDMMKELFELQRFDLQMKTQRLRSENNTAVSHMQGQLQELQGADEAVLKDKKKEEKALKKDVKAHEKQLAEKEAQEKASHALQTAFAELRQLEEEATDWVAREKSIREREQVLADYRQCVLEFKPLMERLNELRRATRAAADGIASRQEMISSEELTLQADAHAFAALEERYKQRDALLQEASGLETLIGIAAQERKRRTLSESLQSANETGVANQERLQTALDEEAVIGKKLETLRQTRLQLADVMQRRLHEAETQRLQADLEREEEEIELIQAAITRMKKAAVEAVAKPVQELALEELRMILERAEAQAAVRREQIAGKAQTTGMSALAEIEEQTVEEVDQLITETEAEREFRAEAIGDVRKVVQEGELQVKALEQEVLKLEAAIGEARKQAGLTVDSADTDEATLIAKTEALRREHSSITREYEKMQGAIAERRQQLERLKGELDARQKQQATDEELATRLSGELDDRIAESRYPTVGAVADILDRDIDIDEEALEIAEFDKQYHAYNERLAALRKATNDKQYDAVEHQSLLGAIAEGKALVAEMHRRLGGLASEVSKLEADLEARKALEERLQEKLDRAENLKTLEQMFRANGFVNYVSSVYLKELCHAANERFQKLTRRQLRLEVTESNSFQVRDFLNNGQVRSAKTLSGGQTFQASLSLALALSDNVQRLAGAKQNFFFLDEGFGTLDGEALRTVIDTLKEIAQGEPHRWRDLARRGTPGRN